MDELKENSQPTSLKRTLEETESEQLSGKKQKFNLNKDEQESATKKLFHERVEPVSSSQQSDAVVFGDEDNEKMSYSLITTTRNESDTGKRAKSSRNESGERKEKERRLKVELKQLRLKRAEETKEKKLQLQKEREQKKIEKEREREEQKKRAEVRKRISNELKKAKELKRNEEELRKVRKRKEEELRKEQKRKDEEEKKEKKQKEKEAIEMKKKRESDRFLSFFSKKERPRVITLSTDLQGPFLPFEIKEGMTVAPAYRRSPLSPNTYQNLLNIPINESYLSNLPRLLPTKNRDDTRAKLYQFHHSYRPPYYGTWRKKSKVITGRRPLAKDLELINYDIESDEEWEEPEGDNCESNEDETSSDDDGEESDEENKFLVEHGYLSEDEGVDTDTDKESIQKEDREKRRERLREKAEEWKQNIEQKVKKYEKLIPILYGPKFDEPSPAASLYIQRAFVIPYCDNGIGKFSRKSDDINESF